jgi:hypothetical protein
LKIGGRWKFLRMCSLQFDWLNLSFLGLKYWVYGAIIQGLWGEFIGWWIAGERGSVSAVRRGVVRGV